MQFNFKGADALNKIIKGIGTLAGIYFSVYSTMKRWAQYNVA